MTAVNDRSAERTTADLLLEWDRSRPRSRQRELGWSDLGVCKRRAAYRLMGCEPSNLGGSLQAVMGTAIHDAVQQRLAETAGPDDLVEYLVVFAGIRGHLDRYEAETGDLVDVKTTTSRWLEHIKVYGPDKAHLWQTGGYGAALIQKGYRVRRIVIDYIARDTGELYRWTGRFELRHVRDALAWLDSIRGMDPEMLNREYAPGSAFCEQCPFQRTCWDGAVSCRDPRSVLYVEQPDAAAWAEKLKRARQDKAEAAERESEAKGALDALRPNEDGTSPILDVGLDGVGLVWQVVVSNKTNIDQVKKDYAKTGHKPPTKPSTSTKLKFVPLPEPGTEP